MPKQKGLSSQESFPWGVIWGKRLLICDKFMSFMIKSLFYIYIYFFNYKWYAFYHKSHPTAPSYRKGDRSIFPKQISFSKKRVKTEKCDIFISYHGTRGKLRESYKVLLYVSKRQREKWMNVYELVLSCMLCTEIRLDIYKPVISC